MNEISKLAVFACIYAVCTVAHANPVVLDSFTAPDLSSATISNSSRLENVVAASLSGEAISQVQTGFGQANFELNLTPQLVDSKAETPYLSGISEPVALSLLGVLLAFLGTLKRKGRA